MSIKFCTIGRVTLTNGNARNILRQVKYGRANVAAISTFKHGLEMNRRFKNSNGKYVFKVAHCKKDAVVD